MLNGFTPKEQLDIIVSCAAASLAIYSMKREEELQISNDEVELRCTSKEDLVKWIKREDLARRKVAEYGNKVARQLEQAKMAPLMNREIITPTKRGKLNTGAPDVGVLLEATNIFVERMYPGWGKRIMTEILKVFGKRPKELLFLATDEPGELAAWIILQDNLQGAAFNPPRIYNVRDIVEEIDTERAEAGRRDFEREEALEKRKAEKAREAEKKEEAKPKSSTPPASKTPPPVAEMETDLNQDYDVSTVDDGPTVATTKEEIVSLVKVIRERGEPALASKKDVPPDEWEAMVKGLEVEPLSMNIKGAEQSPVQRAIARGQSKNTWRNYFRH
eukprot:scaffold65232_cov49-Cyclotella_meneghiniana.AAC.4